MLLSRNVRALGSTVRALRPQQYARAYSAAAKGNPTATFDTTSGTFKAELMLDSKLL